MKRTRLNKASLGSVLQLYLLLTAQMAMVDMGISKKGFLETT